MVIKKLNNRKANEPDEISNKMIKIINKNAPETIKTILEILLNYNYFPDIWKMGKIKLLNKPDKDPKEINAYRSITMLATTSRGEIKRLSTWPKFRK